MTTYHEPGGGEPAPRLRFSVEHWAAFWACPHPALAGRIVTPDVVAYWPGDAEPVRGVTRYRQRIAELLERVPDLQLRMAEHATNGNIVFVRWIARGTGAAGRFELHGFDGIRLRDGLIRENWICYNPVRFEALVSGADVQANGKESQPTSRARSAALGGPGSTT